METSPDVVASIDKKYVVPNGPWGRQKLMLEFGKSIKYGQEQNSAAKTLLADKQALVEYIKRTQGK